MDETGDGFGGEIDGGDAFHDDSGDLATTDGNEDDLSDFELLRRGISEDTAAGAIDFCGHDLVKHRTIIACIDFFDGMCYNYRVDSLGLVV